MGNLHSYIKMSQSKGKLCILYQDKVYIDFVHDDYAIVTKYYLPDRNIAFYSLDNLLYVYSTSESSSRTLLENKKEIYLPKNIYDKIVEIHRLT